MRVTQPSNQHAEAAELSDTEADRVRRRVRLLVDISSRVAEYRAGLRTAADRLTRHEARIIVDLERHGLDVPRLREILWGGHVLIDDPDLYEAWRFPESRERLSSHHKAVDKTTYPDLGLKGPLVREKLHGRTTTGTWVQLEKTPAAMGDGFRLPTWNDVLHLCDFIVYRITKSNVGPWGRSKQTERRPLYLSPAVASSVRVPEVARTELTRALGRAETDDDVTSASPDLARLFPAPRGTSATAELVLDPGTRNGRGLFGASDAHVHAVSQPDSVAALLGATEPSWALPGAGDTTATTLRGGERQIRTVVRRVPATEQQEDAISTAEQPDIPQETLESIVELVGTGPVLLGGYTLAEIDAVGAIRHLQETEPDGALVAEAARSLAARSLISADPGSDELTIRGDLGIATAVQHRSRLTIDARVTGTEPDQPWRFVLMPQPEGITLEVLVDALGIHEYSLRGSAATLERLWERLPSGDRGTEGIDATATIESSPLTALVSINHWDEAGDLETVDLALAREGGTCHAFVRDQQDPSRLVATGMDETQWRDLIIRRATAG